MQALNLPPCTLKLRERAGRTQIYDPLRRRYVALTPEEHVRQAFVQFLVNHLHYPAALMQNEVRVMVGGVARRVDTLLYAPDAHQPRVIVEYKAPHVALTQSVVSQIAAYNSVLRADVLIITNGLQHYALRVDYSTSALRFLPTIPDFTSLP